ncbi:hypothetical protein [Paenibacillus sp. N3.4]|uniref:hypothetical protein n=1 Tax=Paenibacillus sp. N3.4 TaxID=2603222 RepID=UPI0011C8ACB6|nr:hypothetical protein [Paenibacillus sp. N3.4]TXK85769.1 hypothetical protein FU659_02360 [Paenibacillus sp. N3.4]
MHIGIDLDNTVLDATSTYLKYYNMASGLSFTPDDVNDYYLYRLYGWDNEQRKSVFINMDTIFIGTHHPFQWQ